MRKQIHRTNETTALSKLFGSGMFFSSYRVTDFPNFHRDLARILSLSPPLFLQILVAEVNLPSITVMGNALS